MPIIIIIKDVKAKMKIYLCFVLLAINVTINYFYKSKLFIYKVGLLLSILVYFSLED